MTVDLKKFQMHSLIPTGYCSQLIHWHVIIATKSKSTLGAKWILSCNPNPSFCCSCYSQSHACPEWISPGLISHLFFSPYHITTFIYILSLVMVKKAKCSRLFFKKKKKPLFLNYDEWDRDIRDKKKCTSTWPQTKMLAHSYTKSL